MNLFSNSIPDCRLVWDATALSAFSRDPFTYVITCNLGYKSLLNRPEWVFGQIYNEFIQHLLIKNGDVGMGIVDKFIEEAEARGLSALCSANELATKGPEVLQATLENRLAWMHQTDFFKEYKLISVDNAEGVEVDFLLELPIKTPAEEPYYLAGYWDSLLVANANDEMQLFPHEIKTSRKDTFIGYVDYKLMPSIQFRTYELVAHKKFSEVGTKYKGLLVDICSIYKTKPAAFNTGICFHPMYMIDWWEMQVQKVIKRAESMAIEGLLSAENMMGYFPEANPEGMVRYRTEANPEPTYDIFSLSPDQRWDLLREFITNPQPWNPTVKRNLDEY